MMRTVHPREERGLMIRVGSLEIDWPRAIGYFGAIGLAVVYDVIAPPLGLFIATIPILKLFKRPDRPRAIRIVSDLLEGAAKPVGGDSETTIKVVTGEPYRRHTKTHRTTRRRAAGTRRSGQSRNQTLRRAL
jgi:hypothetical protein